MKKTATLSAAILALLSPVLASALPLGITHDEFKSVEKLQIGSQTMRILLVNPKEEYDGVKLMLGDKELARTDGDRMKIEYQFDLPNSKVVLVSEYSGGNACPANYRLVQLNKSGSVTTTKVFGNCSDIPKINVNGERIAVTLPAEDGKRIVEETWTFEKGVLTEPRKRGDRSK
ncbi:hypothetical protein FXN63_17980 [Pigmentiphaga aceris]|uniref:Uncharacterized protein n=1 Tax=Pigmentiphaga aceris TaxID=1940612 RepID=A0A5C0B0N3_9BURK|nr:hypothetical protein [Pigmentiphaga aceris]QEI07516.1 hypothetical protein FXN63_17980 [Pigmentiphaga aceris]